MITALLPLLLLGPACQEAAPVALPPPARIEPTARGRMVRHGEVEGYIARPLVGGSGRVGTLLLVELQDEPARQAALALAAQGGVALAVAPPTPVELARAYLAGMPDVASVVVVCQRASCP